MGARRRWLGLGLALLLVLAGVWLWRSQAAPPPAPVAARPKPTRRVHPRAASPHQRPSEPRENPHRDLAIPVGDTGEPATGPLPAQILVHIVYPDGLPVRDTVRVFSADCYASDVTNQGELSIVVLAETCTLRAGRRDGALWALSDEVQVHLKAGASTDVELVLPKERTGGLGVQIAQREEGIEVMAVLPGTPAERAGLEKGDIIVEVDGLPTDTLTAEEFIEVMTGPEGTDVDFVIAYEADTGWDTEEHTVTRSTIERTE